MITFAKNELGISKIFSKYHSKTVLVTLFNYFSLMSKTIWLAKKSRNWGFVLSWKQVMNRSHKCDCPLKKRSNTSCAIKLLVLPLRVLEKLPDAPVHTVLIWPIYPSLQQAGHIGAFWQEFFRFENGLAKQSHFCLFLS